MAKKIDHTSVATEQTLAEVYSYESKKRSTLGGIAMAALGGDRSALKDFAAGAVVFAENAARREPEEQMVELAEWLIYALSRIQSGDEPNDAFGWSKKRQGRPSGRHDMDELRKRFVIGGHIAGMLANAPDMSEAEAQRLVAEDRHVSIETARNYWEQWQGKKMVR